MRALRPRGPGLRERGLTDSAGGRPRTPRWIPATLAVLSGLGLTFELVMTRVEFFVIRAVCPYCLTALACIAASFVAAVIAWRGSRILSSVETRHA
ncbi:MAG: vitamin K epoxide reductase family protein [candidate division NC10 bacterium]|nr:vitamin K epoxide reductase family protein [candidate division NC10 bacterium]